jgi:hypothetical protein
MKARHPTSQEQHVPLSYAQVPTDAALRVVQRTRAASSLPFRDHIEYCRGAMKEMYGETRPCVFGREERGAG